MFDDRTAITNFQAAIAVVVVIVAAVASGGYILSTGVTPTSSHETDLSIIETDPVNQVDSFSPQNITAAHGTTVTIAIMNGDDAARTFEISAFDVNQTIASGVTARVTFTVGQPGVFEMYVPPTPPSNGLKASPPITGYLIVT